MRIADKTKEQLVEEVESLRLRTAELERTEVACKRGEEAIRRLEEEKLSILNSMSERVVYQNPQHRVLWANKAAVEAADLARERLVGCYCYEIWSKRSEPCVNCPVEKARETGKPQASEMTTPDGRVWLVRGQPIRDTDDQIVGLVEVALEITERKQVEEALRKGERRFELLFESTIDGMFVLDAETMKIVLANQAAVDIFGLNSVEGAIGVNPLDFVPPEERERVLRIIVKDMFENDLRQVNEVRGITKDGREIWVSAVGTRTEYRGKLAGLISFSDITERKQAEEALQAEKNKLQSVIDAMEDGLTIQDRDYNILFESQPSTRTGSYHLGEKCYQAYEGRETVCDDCPVKKAFKDGKSHSAVKKGTTPSGEVSFRENVANPIRDAEGKIISCLELTIDITERKQAEEALRESEEEKSALLEEAPIAIINTNLKGKITYINKRFESETGYSREEIIGKNGLQMDWLPAGTIEYLTKRMVARLQGASGRHWTTQFKCKDGRWIWVEIEGKVLRKLKVPVGFQIIARNVTERKKAEDALRESEEFNASLLENSPNPVVVINPDTSIRYVNPALEKLTGFKSKEVIGIKQPFPWWIDDKTREIMDRIRKKLSKGEQAIEEVLFQKKSGGRFWVNVNAVLVRRNNEPSYTLVNWVKVTERKQAEEALQAEKNKLQSVIDAMEDGLSIQDRDYNILFESQPSTRNGSYHLGEKCYRAYEDREAVCDDCPVEKAFKDGKSHTSERRMVTLSGEVLFLESTANPIRDAKGEIVSCLEVTRNITERKEAEEELKLRAQILDGATDAIFVHDNDDNFVYVNEAACRTHGYSREELMKMKIPQLVDPERSRPLASDRQELLKKGQIVVESAHLRKDGSLMPVEIHARTVGSGKSKLFLTVARDITERKRAEGELRESEERYRNLFEGTYDMIQSVAPDGHFIFANRAWLETMGYTEAELQDLNLFQIIHPESLSHCQKMFAKVMEGESVNDAQATFVAKDGRSVMVEGTAVGRYINGELVATQGIFHDITERKRAEEALRESEEKLRKMFESVTDGISVVNLDGVITDVNQRTVEMHGFSSKDEILGKSALELIAPRDHERVTANMRKALTRRVVRGVEYTLLKADGSEFPGELSSSVLKDAAGEVVGHITISRDITERKEAEELYETLADSSPIGVYILQNGKFRFVNPQFQKYTGFSGDELLGRESLEIVHAEDRERVRENAVKMLKGKRLSPYELRYIVKSGEILWATETVTSIQYQGKRAVLGNFIDITERRRAEEEKLEMEQKAHLASRLASVGEMASGIAHEINNPLTSVIGFSQLLMEGDIPPDIKEDVGIIYKEAQRAAGVAKNLLTFARKQAPAKQPTNVNSILEGVLKLRAYEQRVNNIQVDSQLAPDLPEVMGDYSQLQQVFINIIINAESAMIEANKGGTLTITTQRVNKTVKASFSDDGPGITRENLNRIFDPFFTTKEVGKGTGLGLSVCHGIVAEHGGKMYARSKLGQGATFVVELPVNNS